MIGTTVAPSESVSYALLITLNEGGRKTVLGRPTTSRPYAFRHIFSVHSDRIPGAAHILSHLGRLSAEEDISRSPGCRDRRMVTCSCRLHLTTCPSNHCR